jgi:hypothetical protein
MFSPRSRGTCGLHIIVALATRDPSAIHASHHHARHAHHLPHRRSGPLRFPHHRPFAPCNAVCSVLLPFLLLTRWTLEINHAPPFLPSHTRAYLFLARFSCSPPALVLLILAGHPRLPGARTLCPCRWRLIGVLVSYLHTLPFLSRLVLNDICPHYKRCNILYHLIYSLWSDICGAASFFRMAILPGTTPYHAL